MAKCLTKYFGAMQYDSEAVWRFPEGLPAFEAERTFIPIEHPTTRPLVYLQSLTTPEVCFVGLPVKSIVGDYKLELSEEDRELIGLSGEAALDPGADGILCLALITIREIGTTANLMAPVVANLRTGQAVQAISPAGCYSHQHPLG